MMSQDINNDTKQQQQQCTKDLHSKAIISYCDKCEMVLCLQCATSHNNHIIKTYQDIHKDILQENIELKRKLDEKSKEKEEHSKFFKNEIEEHYNKQVNLVDKYFRELHDQLHFRSIEIKKELKSYYDENLETFTCEISNLEFEINGYEKFLNEFQQQQQQQQQQQEKEIQKYSEFKEFNKQLLSINNSSDRVVNQDYQLASLNHFSVKCILDSIALIDISKSLKNLNTKNSNLVVYRYNKKRGLEKTNLDTLETNVIISLPNIGAPPVNDGYFYQSASTNSQVFLFNEEKYFMAKDNLVSNNGGGGGGDDIIFENVKWVSGQFGIQGAQEKGYYQSTIYDGKDHIYIVGGIRYEGDLAHSCKDIFKFNIHTQKSEKIFDLQITSRRHALSIHGEFLYIVGGYTNKVGYLNKVMRLNLTTLNMDTFMVEADIPTLKDTRSGCYDYINNNLYYVCPHSNVYRYNLQSKENVKLEQKVLINQPKDHVKMHFDGNNQTIYFIQETQSSIFTYNIKDNEWRTLNNIFATPIDLLDYVSFSNNFLKKD